MDIFKPKPFKLNLEQPVGTMTPIAKKKFDSFDWKGVKVAVNVTTKV